MLWSDWVIVGWLSIGCLSLVALVGKPRKPIEPGTAVFSVIVTTGLITTIMLTHL